MHRIRSLIVATGTLAGLSACERQDRSPTESAASDTAQPAATVSDTPHPLENAFRSAPTIYARFSEAAALGQLDDAKAIAALLPRFGSPSDAAEIYARSCLLERLVALDAPAAIAIALENKQMASQARGALADRFGSGTASRQLLMTILKTEELGSALTLDVLEAAARGDDQFVEDAIAEVSPNTLRSLRSDRITELAERSPAEAILALQAIADEDDRIAIADSVLSTCAKSDPAAALEAAFALGSTDSYRIRHAQTKILDQWFESDPAAARRRLLAPDFPLDRNHVNEIANVLAEHDPDTTARWITQINNPALHERAAYSAASALARKSPEIGAALFAPGGQLPEKIRSHGFDNFVRSWAGEDAPAATRWALALSSPHRDQAVRSLVGRLDDSNPEAALELLRSEQITGDLRKDLIKQAKDLAEHDLPGYLELVAELPEDEASETLARTARDLGNDGYLDDAKMIIDSLGVEHEEAKSNVQPIIAKIAASNPQEALDWVAGFKSSEDRAFGAQNIVDVWARVDPVAAAEYARNLPPGSAEAERAALAMANRTLANDPEAALAWVDQIGDQDLRDDFLRRNLAAVLVLSPDAIESLASGAGDELIKSIEEEVQLNEYLRSQAR